VVHIGGESARSDSALSGGRQISALQTESELLYFRKHHGLLGIWSHLVLTLAGNALLGFKELLKGHGEQSQGSHTQNTQAFLNLLLETRWGTKPTR
jgi:N-acetylglucosaminyl-diphospho-decaprenol L-rhamnosyltransferase